MNPASSRARSGMRVVLGLLACFVATAPLAAQEPPEPAEAAVETRFPGASPALPVDHWALRAAARAEALGLAPGYLPPQRAATRSAVAAALVQAVERARAEHPALLPLAEGWLARFRAEFRESAPRAPEPPAPRGSSLRSLGGFASLGVEDVRGRMEPGAGAFDLRTPPLPLPDASGPVYGGAAGAAVGDRLALFAEMRGWENVALPRWEATAAAGGVALSAGRRQPGYGPARSGGIVLGANASMTGVEVQTPRPVRLPGFLRHAGPVSAHTFASRLREDRHVGDPWFWSARLAVQPHPRFTVGVNRAVVFGGDSVAAVTPRTLAGMVVGLLTEDFENQVVAMDFRYRLPSEALVPVTLYLEWGSEDAAGAWWNVPGIVGGAYLPALPGIPGAALGVEHTWFSTFGWKNPPWYLHSVHRGGWAADGSVLGHPLGGEGRETLVYGDLEEPRLGVRVEGRAFLRYRSAVGYETFLRAGNVFAPVRVGHSRGGAVRADVRLGPRTELRLHGFLDRGDGWSERALRTDVSIFF